MKIEDYYKVKKIEKRVKSGSLKIRQLLFLVFVLFIKLLKVKFMKSIKLLKNK